MAEEEQKDQPILTDEQRNLASAMLHDKALKKIKEHQDLLMAILGGACAALVSSLVWAIITVATEYQIGYMAIAVGLIVGFAVRYFGAGIDMIFGVVGGFLALFGCVLGNLFSQIGFIANAQSLGYFETLTYLDFNLILEILTDSFNPMDILFYGIAIYEGYKFSFRKISPETLEKLYTDADELPPYHNYRRPAAAGCVAVLAVLFVLVSRGVNGEKVYYYDSGAKLSEGEMKDSKNHGKWTFYYENGKERSNGYYLEGKADSLWQWYDETGVLTKQGHYKRDIEHGVWIVYHNTGVPSDSGNYFEGRMTGKWKYWYPNGQLSQEGFYKRNLPDSAWVTYYDNGKLNSRGTMKKGEITGKWEYYYDNGQLSGVWEHESEDKVLIVDAWDTAGIQLVKDGFGTYKSFSMLTGKMLQTGEIENKRKVGNWSFYHESGNKKEEGRFENEIFLVTNAWTDDGTQTITDGNGTYISYFANGTSVYETGEIINGYRNGYWKVYHESTGNLHQEISYMNGMLTGTQKVYFQTGELYTEGKLVSNLKQGEWKWYYENGIVSSSVNYVNNKKEGMQTMWGESGEKTKEEYYEKGELVKEELM